MPACQEQRPISRQAELPVTPAPRGTLCGTPRAAAHRPQRIPEALLPVRRAYRGVDGFERLDGVGCGDGGRASVAVPENTCVQYQAKRKLGQADQNDTEGSV
eukprot:gene10700-biopygen7789